MNSSQSSDETQEHSGYGLETGVLSRAREWVDVLPWIRLVRALRIAASPLHLLLVGVTIFLWLIVCQWIVGKSFVLPSVGYVESGSHQDVLRELVCFSDLRNLVSVFAIDETTPSMPKTIGTIFWSIIIWMPSILLLNRQGALLTAGREMMGFRDGVEFAVRRTPIALLLASIPLLCVGVFAGLIFCVGYVSKVLGLLEVPGYFVALLSIPCGILAYGAVFAVPLGTAAIAVEEDPDALDSLSRGYEYLYRRPLHTVFYVGIGFALLVLVSWLSSRIRTAAIEVSDRMLDLSGAADSVKQASQSVLDAGPPIVVLAMLAAATGGVYLLLRRDAGGQEVEDIWQPPAIPVEPLPELPQREEKQ